MSRENTSLTVRQQVWLAAWTAAIQSPAKYNPKSEADACLGEFDALFGPKTNVTLISEKRMIKDVDAEVDDSHTNIDEK